MRTDRTLRLGGKPPIARLAVAEVLPHRLARRRGIARGDRVADRDMLPLESFEISALALRAMGCDPDALARDDEATEIFEEMRKLRVAGRRGDGAVKREILVDRRLAAHQRSVDRAERLPDPPAGCRSAAARGKTGGFDIDAGSSLHDCPTFRT